MKNKKIKRLAGILSPTPSIILLILLISSCNYSEEKQVDQEKQTSSLLPYLKETNGVKQLMVDDAPFIILGGELLNSSASSIEYIESVWSKVKLLNVNTVFLPINWQQFESVSSNAP